MPANTSLSVSSLDFDTIRERLTETLKADPKFKDWDFLGSNISVLLDLLSYNTYMNNFYVNMNLAESFLDTAQLRDSAVSKAKELNYTPRSMVSAKALLNLRLQAPDNPPTITVPAGTTAYTRIDNAVLSFVTASPVILRASDNYAADIEFWEGTIVTESFLVDTSQSQRFILSNDNIDTASLSVSVDGVEYTRATSLLGLSANDNIYFCQATSKNKYELVFGDSVHGAALLNNSTITASYRITSGTLGNGGTIFSLSSNISGYAGTLSTVEKSSGGADRETLASIKYNAPRHYQTQERAVTKTDHEVLILENFPEVRTVNIFGGEEVVPPKYGKVFISVDLHDSEKVPTALKTSITSFISSRNMLAITPVVTDAEHLYLVVNAQATFDQNSTSDQPADVESAMFQALVEYDQEFMNDFSVIFMPSKLSTRIDSSHPSIISTNISYTIMKILETSSAILDFQNDIQINSLESSAFDFSGTTAKLTSALTPGTIDIVSTLNNTLLASNVGTVSSNGSVTINLGSVTSIPTYIHVSGVPGTEIKCKNNVIFNVYRPLSACSATGRRI